MSLKPKKLSIVHKDRKQAAIDSPKREQENISQVMTATKHSKESSDKEEYSNGSDSKETSVKQEHSTESDLSRFQVKPSTRSRTSTISNLPSMADPRLDAKVEHLLKHFFLAKGNTHEV